MQGGAACPGHGESSSVLGSRMEALHSVQPASQATPRKRKLPASLTGPVAPPGARREVWKALAVAD